MDQNTNNSFTSAPQGGDFSDVIIPNAYAAKPKGKNLKKYIVFGIIGLFFIFLLSFLFKKKIIDSKNVSKEELTEIASSENIKNIDGLERTFFKIYNNYISFDDVFNPYTYKKIHDGQATLVTLKKVTDNKQKSSGSKNAAQAYDLFRKAVDERYKLYMEAIATYDDFYKAYNDMNVEILSKYSSGNLNYKIAAHEFTNIINQSVKMKELIDNKTCDTEEDLSKGSPTCQLQYKNLNDSFNGFNNVNGLRRIFSAVYELKDYANLQDLSDYINAYMEQI
ncbi:MAG: hypothetical protein HXL10_00540 [Candidatus Nanosynbacter sp.]|nr:hypothetical protein [Candidatus Nanosynbacter sp.]